MQVQRVRQRELAARGMKWWRGVPLKQALCKVLLGVQVWRAMPVQAARAQRALMAQLQQEPQGLQARALLAQVGRWEGREPAMQVGPSA